MDTTMHGFRLVSSSELKEIKGTADIYKHDKSGLTMVHLNCEDTNKTFSMSFCTPPETAQACRTYWSTACWPAAINTPSGSRLWS